MGGMSLPITLPVQPMLAKAVTSVPEGDEFTYEPKWDGFRCIVARDGDDVELHSRGSKLLTRYFPELVEALKSALPERVVLDGEIVLRQGSPGHERLSWDALSARIHPAASRIEKLAAETPAQFVAFDLLAEGDDDVMGEPFEKRRARLEALFAQWPTSDSVYLTRTTRDADEARRWFEQFEGAGLDGVVATNTTLSRGGLRTDHTAFGQTAPRGLAADLRRQMREQFAAGRTDAEVTGWLVQRYGDYVHYRPPLDRRTALLWATPALLGGAGAIALALQMRQRRRLDPAAFDPDE